MTHDDFPGLPTWLPVFRREQTLAERREAIRRNYFGAYIREMVEELVEDGIIAPADDAAAVARLLDLIPDEAIDLVLCGTSRELMN